VPEIKPVGASAKKAMLIHADSGWGKTSFIGTAAQAGIPVIIMHPPIDHMDPIVGSGAQEMVVRHWEDIWEGLDQMRHEGAQLLGPDGWFWMDSVSLLQDIGLDDVYDGVLDRAGRPGSAERKYRENFGPDRGEYRVNMWRLGKWIREAVSDGSFHLGINAHSFYWEGNETNNPGIYPWIQGKAMPAKICGMMNIVGYGNLEEVSGRGGTREARVIHWNKTDDYYAKNQFKKPDGTSTIPDGRTINPTLPGVLELLDQGRVVARGRRGAAPSTPNTGVGPTGRRPSSRPSARR
jgi:hypothetical protein